MRLCFKISDSRSTKVPDYNSYLFNVTNSFVPKDDIWIYSHEKVSEGEPENVKVQQFLSGYIVHKRLHIYINGLLYLSKCCGEVGFVIINAESYEYNRDNELKNREGITLYTDDIFEDNGWDLVLKTDEGLYNYLSGEKYNINDFRI